MEDVRDRVAFVTGGASGIGLGIAKALLDASAKVAIADLRPDHLEEAKRTLAAHDNRILAVEVDVTDREAMARAAEAVDAAFGRVDILVNNAGVGIEGPLAEASYADWDFGIGVNLGGVINGLMTFVPRIRAGGRGGHVVNTASLAGMVQMPSFMAIYAAAKAGVIALTEAMRGDLAQNDIGCTVLCPGPVRSRIHEFGRNRPARFQASEAFAAAADRLGRREVSALWMEPEEVGRMVLNAILANELYVITHGEWRGAVQARHDQIMAATPTAVNPDLIASLMPKD
ncbi:MAG TPA: SDR family NAD(P)-dependent oxidoreductase [Allosphingosinicella sp.]|nr:SDR family NAD(P)-dependent oxidoreductase [Allosphingosinicella sp.]